MAVSPLHVRVADLQLNRRLARNLILTHARAVRLYRSEYKNEQQGKIGITLVSHGGFLPVCSNIDMSASAS
jgi:hypothetical protein